jgi:hypothetical protein
MTVTALLPADVAPPPMEARSAAAGSLEASA